MSAMLDLLPVLNTHVEPVQADLKPVARDHDACGPAVLELAVDKVHAESPYVNLSCIYSLYVQITYVKGCDN